MNAYREFWTVPLEEVPHKTGAINANGVDDLKEVLDRLGVDLSSERVLDVGCGTGRLSELCGAYFGADVSGSQVLYALELGLVAVVIDGPEDFTRWSESCGYVCCFSVFTHIPREERQAYLAQFRRIAPRLVVDILPSSEGGGIPAWYASPEEFENDLHAAGYTELDTYMRVSRDGYAHLYYHAR